MSANHDAALAAYLRANRIVAADKLASAQTHQSVVMPSSSLAQVLLHLKYIGQDALASAVRAVDASLNKSVAKAASHPVEALTRAVGDATHTSHELAAVARLIDEELKHR